jgi:MFS family permease
MATSESFVFSILVFNLFSGSITPYTRTLVSNSVNQSLQAQVFSGFSAFESIASLLGPLFGIGYSLSVGMIDGLVYFVMSSFAFAAALIIVYVIMDSELRRNIPDHAHNLDSVNREGEIEGLMLPNDVS